MRLSNCCGLESATLVCLKESEFCIEDSDGRSSGDRGRYGDVCRDAMDAKCRVEGIGGVKDSGEGEVAKLIKLLLNSHDSIWLRNSWYSSTVP